MAREEDTFDRAASGLGSTIVRAGRALRKVRKDFGSAHEPRQKMITSGLACLAAMALLLVLLGRWSSVPLIDYVEKPMQTARVRMFETGEARDPDILIIAIDERALQYGDNPSFSDAAHERRRYGWPWPRHVYNKLIRYCRAGGARVVAFDLLFSETGPSTNDPFRMVDFGGRPRRVWMGEKAGDDLFLLEATAGDDVCLAVGMNTLGREHERKDDVFVDYSATMTGEGAPALRESVTRAFSPFRSASVPYRGLLNGLPVSRFMSGIEDLPEAKRKEDVGRYYNAMVKRSSHFRIERFRSLFPLPKPSMHGVGGAGMVLTVSDPADGAIRRMHLLAHYEGHEYRSFALEIYRLYVLSYAREAQADATLREAFGERFAGLSVDGKGLHWRGAAYSLAGGLREVPLVIEDKRALYLGASVPIDDQGRFQIRYHGPLSYDQAPAWQVADEAERKRIQQLYESENMVALYPTVSAADILQDYDHWRFNTGGYQAHRDEVIEEIAELTNQLEEADDDERNELQLQLTSLKEILDRLPEVPSSGWLSLRYGSPESLVKDKIVYIAGTAAALSDLHQTPLWESTPGTLVQATTLDNIKNNDFMISLPGWLNWLLAIGLLLASCLTMLNAKRMRRGVLVTLLLGVGVMAASWVMFSQQIWFPTAAPLAALLLGFTHGALAKAMTEGVQRRHREAFARQYMGQELVDFVINDPDSLKLGGENRSMTIYFSDVAGFTTVTETLGAEHPERLVDLLNIYLERMTDVMLETGGVIDKYIGDAIMCFWGAPRPMEDHAVRACQGALACKIEMSRMQPLFKDTVQEVAPQLVKPDGTVLTARAGINSGVVTVGNMGSSKRFAYTVMGDAVNLASRLEAQNKAYGSEIIIGENSEKLIRGEFTTRRLDLIVVKGKTEPTEIFELLGGKDAPQFIRDLCRHFEAGIDLFRDRQFERALECFKQALEHDHAGGDRDALNPSGLYIARCMNLIETPPDADWNGVYIKTSK